MRVCKNGHNVVGDNLYIDPRGKSHCKPCRKIAAQKHRDTEGTAYRLAHKKRVPKAAKAPNVRKPYPKNRTTKPAMDRFMSKVSKTETCWLWGGMLAKDGYGLFCFAKRKTVSAHRWVFTELIGPIADGNEIDHMCFVRNCVNPEHLEQVSHAENVARSIANGNYAGRHEIGKFQAAKTHCKRGHEYSKENTYIDTHSGGRRCRACMKAARERRYGN
jgi:hypothetical protein